jgi:hypothetical protein
MTPVALRAAMRSPRGVQVRRPASHRSTYVTSCPFPRQLLFSRYPCSQLFDSVVVWGGGIVQTEMLSMCSCHSACRWHCHVVSLKTLPQVSPTVANAALVFSARDRRKARPKKGKENHLTLRARSKYFVLQCTTMCPSARYRKSSRQVARRTVCGVDAGTVPETQDDRALALLRRRNRDPAPCK